MRKPHIIKICILVALIPSLALCGCHLLSGPADDSPVTYDDPQEAPPPQAVTHNDAPPTRGRFTLRYDPNSALNPITSLNSDNILLSSLMYESLFILDGNLNVEPLLCESWTMEDDYTFIFEIKPDVAMSDGSFLSADDVAYSLKQAMHTGRFVNRLKIIDSVTATGDLTVSVVLNSSNSRFIRLLDIPIIKNGSIDNNVPPGTGPYIFTGAQSMRLDSFPRYRDFTRLPVMTIYLRECDDNEKAELFDDGVLTLLWDDPSDAFDIRLNRLHEKHYYETTTLQFIGFNTRSVALQDPDLRRAIGSSIDRQYIADYIMPRQALASPLALSPAYGLYDTNWERTYLDDPIREMSALLHQAGLEDYNFDSYLEYPDGYGGFTEFSIDFIVNSENEHKIQVANMITETLKLYGFNISVRELPWDSFINALQTGDFDMYYGEIVLSADFDLSPLLMPGSRLNYGRTGNSEFGQYIDAFLYAQTENGERAAAKRLCEEITRNAPFVPVVYKRYVIYLPIGAISGASPSQSGVFRNFTDWTIDLTVLS